MPWGELNRKSTQATVTDTRMPIVSAYESHSDIAFDNQNKFIKTSAAMPGALQWFRCCDDYIASIFQNTKHPLKHSSVSTVSLMQHRDCGPQEWYQFECRQGNALCMVAGRCTDDALLHLLFCHL